jgi:hypothetical protein
LWDLKSTKRTITPFLKNNGALTIDLHHRWILTLLNIQLLFYGMTYLMILEKNANFNQFKNILLSWNGNECKCNACKKH